MLPPMRRHPWRRPPPRLRLRAPAPGRRRWPPASRRRDGGAVTQRFLARLARGGSRLYLSGPMGPFAWGLLVGCLGGLALAAAAVLAAYRRIDRLQRRARQAERLAELGTLTGGLAPEVKNHLYTLPLPP